jgi:hypothetical protein
MRYRSPRVVRLGGWSPQLPAGFPVSRGTRVHDQPIASPSPTGLSPSSACLPRQLGSPTLLGRVAAANPTMPHNPEAATAAALARPRFGLNPVRSPLLGVSRLIPLPRGTKMFQFPRFPSYTYEFSARWRGITHAGLPHSEIRGSTLVDSSPRLFAVPRVLHRPLAPRHPPRALLRSAPPHGSPEPPASSSLAHYSSLLKVPEAETYG